MENDKKKYLKQRLALAGFADLDGLLDDFDVFYSKLLFWNSKINLISRNDEKNIIERHFLESLTLLDICEFPVGAAVIDIGTGAGFPGLPIGIVRNDLKITLVDSKRKKTLFLKEILSVLKLKNIVVQNERIEKLAEINTHHYVYDFVITRAVAKLSKLYEWSKKLLNSNGSILAIKGGCLHSEVDELENMYSNISIEILTIDSDFYINDGERVIVKISKI